MVVIKVMSVLVSLLFGFLHDSAIAITASSSARFLRCACVYDDDDDGNGDGDRDDDDDADDGDGEGDECVLRLRWTKSCPNKSFGISWDSLEA